MLSENKNQTKIACLLSIVKKTREILKEKDEKTEVQKLLQSIEQKYQFNSKELEIDKEIDQVDWLLEQRKDIREDLDYISRLVPVNSRHLLREIQSIKKTTKELSSGEKYYYILSRIQYIFPKPHAIAYTTTAWRTAYYKVYHPREFYSVLLTYHVAVHDIWLMTFEPANILFRLGNLLENVGKAKNSEKEIVSIVKVLQELIKSISGNKADKKEYLIHKQEEISTILQNVKQNIISQIESPPEETDITNKNLLLGKILPYLSLTELDKKRVRDKISFVNNYSFRDLKLTAKEKELTYTLKIILEMKQKNLDFRLGLDFNKSEVKNFQIIENKILIPFSAITGIGEIAAKRIIDYRQQTGQITNWKEELSTVLNKNHLQQLGYLEKYQLIIN